MYICVHLRYKDINVSYSKLARTGHGQCHITFPNTARGYYMCWYARDRVLQWARPRLDTDDAIGHARGHAADPERDWYYYRISFCGLNGGHTGQVPGGQFGQPLGSADQFPGWNVVTRHWEELMAMPCAGHVFLL